MLGYELLKGQNISNNKKNALMHKCSFGTYYNWVENASWWRRVNTLDWVAPFNWDL